MTSIASHLNAYELLAYKVYFERTMFSCDKYRAGGLRYSFLFFKIHTILIRGVKVQLIFLHLYKFQGFKSCMSSGVDVDSSNMDEETLVKTSPYMLRVDSFQLNIYH